MNILLLGSGGREHALAWKIIQSPLCKNLYVAPGNAGTQTIAVNLSFADDDFESIKSACLSHLISMVVVGPETPLVKGIVDFFKSDALLAHIDIIGPDKMASQLEGSKDFSKKMMQAAGIPTAAYATFTSDNFKDGLEYIKKHPLPVVLKADGLAAGKGVLICPTTAEAVFEYSAMLHDQKFGVAGSKVVIEEFLKGVELSVFVVTDGIGYQILPCAKDYKRIGVGDTGLNTGGMGAVSPVPFADQDFLDKVDLKIIIPLLQSLKRNGIHYKGFLFIGLMSVMGEPYVIEFNCRLGDPETEVVIPRIKSDLIEIFQAIAQGKVNELSIEIIPETAVTTFLVSGGYPETYEKGKVITGLDEVTEAQVFQAGTRLHEGHTLTNGGRVMAVTSMGHTIEEAARKSRAAAHKIHFEGKYFRTDIGLDLISP